MKYRIRLVTWSGNKPKIHQESILLTQKSLIPLWPLPTNLPLPYWVIYPQFLNASYGQSGICSEVPGLCGGNIIKVVKDVKGEEWGWHQANFTLGTRMARSKPGLLPRNTDQRPLSSHQRSKKRGKRTPNYANPQDEYILILLEYKLMPWLSGWTFGQERKVDRITFTFSAWGDSG